MKSQRQCRRTKRRKDREKAIGRKEKATAIVKEEDEMIATTIVDKVETKDIKESEGENKKEEVVAKGTKENVGKDIKEEVVIETEEIGTEQAASGMQMSNGSETTALGPRSRYGTLSGRARTRRGAEKSEKERIDRMSVMNVAKQHHHANGMNVVKHNRWNAEVHSVEKEVVNEKNKQIGAEQGVTTVYVKKSLPATTTVGAPRSTMSVDAPSEKQSSNKQSRSSAVAATRGTLSVGTRSHQHPQQHHVAQATKSRVSRARHTQGRQCRSKERNSKIGIPGKTTSKRVTNHRQF